MKYKYVAVIIFGFLLLACSEQENSTQSATADIKNQTLIKEEAVKTDNKATEASVTTVINKAIQPPKILADINESSAIEAATQTKKTIEEKSLLLTRDKALALAQISGCLACHKLDVKLVGPAWQEVAIFYRGVDGAKESLIDKVKKGGKGNWTRVTGGIAMPPYSPRVTDENIEALVVFILSL